MMLVPLTAADAAASTATAAAVGGKASSLAKLYSIPSLRGQVPKSYALSTNFFQPWAESLATGEHARAIHEILQQGECSGGEERGGALALACETLKQQCLTIPLSAAQELTLQELSRTIANEFSHGLAAVRSSATEEDGAEHSFAGQFETQLGVAPSQLEEAVRECFASKFDVRVVRYMATHGDGDASEAALAGGFALVVMEMVDAAVAGVSFSANPINSDRDECVVDSSYGLGESVVDGSVTADRFIYDKVHNKLIDKTIGTKKVERRLNFVDGGGVRTLPTMADRQNACSLSDEQLKELVRLTTIVEEEYGTPVDVEWTYDQINKLVLLQARPITTLFWLDGNMMTEPGERRMLYYDMNIASEATTTTPFRHMDMTLYCRLANLFMGMDENEQIFKKDPMMPMFVASTRQYINLSIIFKFVSPKTCAKEAELLDPYLASLFASKDCNRKKYRMKRLPKGVNVRNLWYFLRKAPFLEWYRIGKRAKNHPKRTKEDYLEMLAEDMAKLDELKRRGYRKEEGLQMYSSELIHCFWPSRSLDQDCGIIYAVVLGLFRSLDKKRREGKTEQVRSEYDALCGGYEGDELMQMNIDLYRLANTLSSSVWDQYGHDQLHLLAERIQMNLDGVIEDEDVPSDFLSEWTTFMDRYGFDGDDQLFISPPRYQDNPVMLLARLRQNAGAHLKDPAVALERQISERRRVMKLQEDRLAAKWLRKPFALKRMKQRNQCLEHLMRIRNAPKLHMSKVYGVLRENVLQVEVDLMKANRLEAKDDIFHCDLGEIDQALADESFDLIALVRPRKEVYERALRANECPLLIDSRCRILRPDPPSREDVEEGTLIGAAVSPGVASGRVRVMKSPTDYFESGEVLAATVTSPAWTPLFVGASAVILQIGGVLQHGALCAREYGKPAVSNIDIHNDLKTGMKVRVDGNKGTVEVLSEGA